MFDRVAGRYDLVNAVITLGLDGVWRRRAARRAAAGGGDRWLDVCTGTGDMACELRQRADTSTLIIAVDFSEPMLRLARERLRPANVPCVLAEVGALPFADESFDLVTISFATRNIHTSREALVARFAEFRRVLRVGGWFVNLESSQPPGRLLRWLFRGYVRLWVRPVGSVLSGAPAAYRYLSSTVARFYDAEALTEFLCEAGFGEVAFQRLTRGAVAVHVAVK